MAESIGVDGAWDPNLKGSLHGVRVLDMSRLVAGNALTHVLADHGAEVIKVERPGRGDDLRNWKTEGHATHWKVYCRNKRSVTLDYRAEGANELFLKLVKTAHALVENFKPGTLEKMGLGTDVLHKINPKLVIVRISGWGQDGMWSHKPGFGSLVEAMGGYASVSGFSDRPPLLPPTALADMIAGLYGSMAVMAAIRHVEVEGGNGQIIDLPLLDAIHSVLGPLAANYALTGQEPERIGSLSDQTAPRNVYQCRDGKHVALSASMQAMAERLFRAMGQPELIDDPRFRTNSDRVAHKEELDAIVANFMASHDQKDLLDLFEREDVTVGPVVGIAEFVQHPYVHDRRVVLNMPDEDAGQIPMHHVVARMSDTPGGMIRQAPALGQDNDQIWRSIGEDPDYLRSKGVI